MHAQEVVTCIGKMPTSLLCLQLIPGMTKSGKQKTPDWLNKFLGVKEEDVPKDVPRPAGFPDINGKPTQ